MEAALGLAARLTLRQALPMLRAPRLKLPDKVPVAPALKVRVVPGLNGLLLASVRHVFGSINTMGVTSPEVETLRPRPKLSVPLAFRVTLEFD